jgi:hypothetical protein
VHFKRFENKTLEEQVNLTDTVTKAGASLSRAQEQVKDLGRTAGEKLDAARSGTADALENAAFSVRTNGRDGAKTIETMSESAAGKLDSTAAYVRSHDVGGMLSNLRQVVSENPGGFLILAAGIGFLAGSAFRRNNSNDQA